VNGSPPYRGPRKYYGPRGARRRRERGGGRLRRVRKLALAALAVGLTFAYFAHALQGTGTNGCPPKTEFGTSVMSDYCTPPGRSERVVCVLTSFGFTPTPGGDVQGDQYTRRPPLGPWCKTARPLTYGPQVRSETFNTK
jgi:hypothetical protein